MIHPMTKTSHIVLVIVAVLLLASSYLFLISNREVRAADATQLAATIKSNYGATTTNPTVGPIAETIFATSSCAARIISTKASALRLSFNGASSTGELGHLQLASTTEVYDAGQWGCGRVTAYSFVSQLLYISESQ